jgi:alanine racemase
VGYGHAYVTEREEVIGVVPVGYGDGLRRGAGNQILIGGEKCPAVGKLCLDHLMVRLPRLFPLGEEVVVIGSQGAESIGLHDLATRYQTTQVDIATHLHRRVPRVYVHG